MSAREPSTAADGRPTTTFVCHASEDHDVADTLRAALETHGLRCWIAPRDVPAGANYADAIVSGIVGSDAVLLVFSHYADASPHVRRELEQAVNNDLRIVPVRIEDKMPSPEVRYYLGSWQWLDAFPPPINDHLTRVVDAVRTVRSASARRRKNRVALYVAAGVVLVALAAILAVLLVTSGGTQRDDAVERVRACMDTHGLSKASTKRVLSGDNEPYEAVFQACTWPPAPGADGDGFSEITVTTSDGPGRSEAEGLTVFNRFSSQCAALELKYLFGNQERLVAQKPFVVSKGELRRVEDGSLWRPRTSAEASIYTPGRDEFGVLSNRRYQLDFARCAEASK